ncbi:MAG: hypothetical protein HUK21_00685 [Fibrobacteraceae bacterium]|nr:hypothetical protein [Fibrobacteraceae bacterium]
MAMVYRFKIVVVALLFALVSFSFANDFYPHTPSTKEFNETWSYQFVFDNGTRAFVSYSTLYIPGTGPKIGCELTFWNFNGKTYTVGRQYPPERLKASKATATIDIKGEYKMEGAPGINHRVLFTADKGGKFFLDLKFDSALPGKNYTQMPWFIKGNKFSEQVHIPYGRVSGKIGYNSDTLTVKGYAYMDQNWQTVQATDIAVRSICFSTNAQNPMYAGRISISTEGKLIGYALYNDGSGVKVITPKRIQDGANIESASDYNGKKFPKEKLIITWNEDVPPLSFDVEKPFQKASILDKVDGWLAKKAMKMVAGEILFYRGRSDGSNGKKIDWSITGEKD